MKIVKSSGEITNFNEEKVRRSIRKTGVSEAVVDDILRIVRKRLRPQMKTSAIYRIVRQELRKRRPWAASRYDLRAAIIRLGPAGFHFEKYVASVLSAYGYKTKTPKRDLKGACITHEVDVLAEKEGRNMFIEAKFRKDFTRQVNIKDTMATWARFLDLVDGSKMGFCPHFDECWIVTNARFTDQSHQYGHCKNMMLIGWDHPKERSFAHMVDMNALYPVTVMEDLTEAELKAFAAADITLCREVCKLSDEKLKQKTGISLKRLKTLKNTCDLVVNGHHIDENPENS